MLSKFNSFFKVNVSIKEQIFIYFLIILAFTIKCPSSITFEDILRIFYCLFTSIEYTISDRKLQCGLVVSLQSHRVMEGSSQLAFLKK